MAYRYYFLLWLLVWQVLLFCTGCTHVPGEPHIKNSPPSATLDTAPPVNENHDQVFGLKVFETTAADDKTAGWGYDIYVDSVKTIHQPVIPALPGNNAFAHKEDAVRTGNFAITKMKETGSLPSLSRAEIDSLLQ